MRRNELNDVSIFVAVAQENGFRAAAEKLKLGAGSVSEAVQRFEDRLGVRLIERSTRAIALTKAGELLFRRSLPAINDLETALKSIHDLNEDLSGTLRLTAPTAAGQLFLDALITGFAKEHPAVAIELIYDETKVDLVTSGVDAAIRAETLLDPDTYAIAIGPTLKMTIVASPEYLANCPPLEKPADVAAHSGVCFAITGADKLAPWVFAGTDGPYSVMPRPKIVTNDVTSILEGAKAGLGLAYIFASSVESLLEDGRLVQVLEGQTADLPRFSLNYLSKRNMPPRVRAFVDYAKRCNP
ncbi:MULTISPECIES: LysR family transcriptional regulator [Ruegeria]|uniref:LysR family transcriptional regulator n=1 Tax=Ruegeria atlantica TaxID=81569 RepID=A0AA91BN58_9RHOB|nr:MULTISPECIES: LysR family transcriptional regulator [Ruegeria]NOC47740.1 LysR family transcriptional regulator [Ruegeria sp. HKCCD7559]NOC94551.1 LysR family transcriptional regulator [Ruegeria sp. HKCCD6604]NOD32826.1 LysR family transcriptional regulator [Ruegeria atlantica]NOD86603.1 LysR family transcriptional regulator [Ruegeria sp. HKCCD6119]NOE18460.1 LysR family transcriptional regulator [Ruegeria atlantica]